jgi:hypothetical protein
MTGDASLDALGQKAGEKSAASKRLFLSTRSKSRRKVVTPSRERMIGVGQPASNESTQQKVHLEAPGTEGGADSSSDALQEEIQERGPLGEFSILHDGKYDPATMEAFETLRIKDVYVVGQGEDPQSHETGWINIEALILKMKERNPNGIRGWMELDFERPFVPILREGSTHPRFAEMVTLMKALVVRVKMAFPEAQVTIYNVPALPWYVPQPDGSSVGWASITSEQRAAALAKLHDLKPLLDLMDWFLPRYYDIRPTSELSESDLEHMVPGEIDYRVAHVEWLRAYVDVSDRPDRKIFPAVRTRWVGGASSYASYNGLSIPKKEFLNEQVRPAINSGANGVFIWGGAENYAIHIAFTSPDNWSEEMLEKAYRPFREIGILGSDEVPDWTSATQKRAFKAALGAYESPYVASTALLMREKAVVTSSQEKEPEQETDEATTPIQPEKARPNGTPDLSKNQSIRTDAELKMRKKPKSGLLRGKKAKSSRRQLRSASAS